MTGFALSALVGVTFLVAPAGATDAPDGPGARSVWAPADKEFLGTSVEPVASAPASRVYFTGAEGILTEVFYPTLDHVQNVDLQLLVVDHDGTFKAGDAEERRQSDRKASLADPRALLWSVVTTSNNHKWRTTKKFFADPKRSSVIERVEFQTLDSTKNVSDYDVYVLNNPAINGAGGGQDSPPENQDNSRNFPKGSRTFLVASKPNTTASALGASIDWRTKDGQPMISSGFVGVNDGYTDLFGADNDRRMDWLFTGAFGGNVAQMGLLDFKGSTADKITFDIVLSFGGSEDDAAATAAATLDDDRDALEQSYVAGWKTYTGGLSTPNLDHLSVPAAEKQKDVDVHYLAAMCLKTSQDKSNGAMVAGMGTPWGESNGDGNRGGYHLVWARDLFKFSSALLAAGDVDSAARAVEYLFNVQMQKANRDSPLSREGRFPQNTFVNGDPYWNGTQMDETAMPIILAWKLKQADAQKLTVPWGTIKKAAEFLAKNGPTTGQDRWEEMGGYSPSTIAAEVAGLVCAADLADEANDAGAARFYRQTADEWRNNVANGTFTTTGFHGNHHYYIRIDANQDPNDDVQLQFANGAGKNGERWIVDGGFLELVRMGVLSPNDWTITETLPVYDQILKQDPGHKGAAWFRYNYDGYGEHNDGHDFDGTGRGRLWPIFTAERGIYEIAKAGKGDKGGPYLQALRAFSSEAGLIPEQVWNESATITGWRTDTPPPHEPGTATKSMRPLNWAMGEYINLLQAVRSEHGDAPSAVTRRYQTDRPQTTITFEATVNTRPGEEVYLVGPDPLLGESVPTSGVKMTTSAATYPKWTATVSLPANTTFDYHYAKIRNREQVPWPQGAAARSVATGAEGAKTGHADSP